MKLDINLSSAPLCYRYHAISILFSNYPSLLNQFFSEDRSKIEDDWLEVTKTHGDIGQATYLLRLASSIWSGRDTLSSPRFLNNLGKTHRESLYMAESLVKSAPRGPCKCDYCIGWMRESMK